MQKDKTIDQLIEEALEGVEYALDPKNNLTSLPGTEVIPQLKTGLLNYKEDKDLTKLREYLGLYQKSNMLTSGKVEYDAVWYQVVEVRGKTILLGSIFDNLIGTVWKLVKNEAKLE